MVILHLAGVSAHEIAFDHSLSHDNLTKLHQQRGSKDERHFIEKTMLEAGITTHEVMADLFATIDIRLLLLANGCSLSHFDLIASRIALFSTQRF